MGHMSRTYVTAEQLARDERAWAALAWGAADLAARPIPLAEIEDGLDQPDPPLTGRALFLAERQERIDEDYDWFGDDRGEGW